MTARWQTTPQAAPHWGSVGREPYGPAGGLGFRGRHACMGLNPQEQKALRGLNVQLDGDQEQLVLGTREPTRRAGSPRGV